MRLFASLLAGVVLLGCVTEGADRESDPASRDPTLPEALLWSQFSTLVIEVDYHPEVVPSKEALESLVTVAKAQTGKENVVLLEPDPFSDSVRQRRGPNWTLEEVRAAHGDTFDQGGPFTYGQDEAVVALHVLYLDSFVGYEYRGRWIEVAGLQMGNVLVLWPDDSYLKVGKTRASLVPGTIDNGVLLETGLLQHEFGHALGLVDHGIPMVRPHNDPNDPDHSSNPDSIMAGGWDQIDELRMKFTRGDAPSLRFDDDDLADIRAFREADPSKGG